MECPVCKNVQLLMSDRQGIEIDYCPNCRGVWLDRGELDKIIERSLGQQPAAAAPAAAPAQSPQGTGWGHSPQPNYPQQQQHQQPQHQQQHYQQQHGYPHPHHGYHKKKKKEGFLSDLFDFD